MNARMNVLAIPATFSHFSTVRTFKRIISSVKLYFTIVDFTKDLLLSIISQDINKSQRNVKQASLQGGARPFEKFTYTSFIQSTFKDIKNVDKTLKDIFFDKNFIIFCAHGSVVFVAVFGCAL